MDSWIPSKSPKRMPSVAADLMVPLFSTPPLLSPTSRPPFFICFCPSTHIVAKLEGQRVTGSFLRATRDTHTYKTNVSPSVRLHTTPETSKLATYVSSYRVHFTLGIPLWQTDSTNVGICCLPNFINIWSWKYHILVWLHVSTLAGTLKQSSYLRRCTRVTIAIARVILLTYFLQLPPKVSLLWRSGGAWVVTCSRELCWR
jgi:hypothetical protein